MGAKEKLISSLLHDFRRPSVDGPIDVSSVPSPSSSPCLEPSEPGPQPRAASLFVAFRPARATQPPFPCHVLPPPTYHSSVVSPTTSIVIDHRELNLTTSDAVVAFPLPCVSRISLLESVHDAADMPTTRSTAIPQHHDCSWR